MLDMREIFLISLFSISESKRYFFMLQNTVPKIIFGKGARLKILSHVTILVDPWQESHRPL